MDASHFPYLSQFFSYKQKRFNYLLSRQCMRTFEKFKYHKYSQISKYIRFTDINFKFACNSFNNRQNFFMKIIQVETVQEDVKCCCTTTSKRRFNSVWRNQRGSKLLNLLKCHCLLVSIKTI